MSVSEPDRERLQTSRPPETNVATSPLAALPPASSSPEEGQQGSRRIWYFGIGLAVTLLAVIGVLFATIPAVITPAENQATTTAKTPKQVLAPLANHGDLKTCRNTLQQMNILLSTRCNSGCS